MIGDSEEIDLGGAGADALGEHVAAYLRDMVIRGALRPGERIVERSLCVRLGVSRTPMREALKLLRQDGLIEINRNRGARVASYEAPEAESLFEVLAELEAMAAFRFVRMASPAHMAKLEGMHAHMAELHGAQRLDDYFDANSAIHDLIIEGAGNPILAESHKRLMLRARRGRYMAIMDAARWDQAILEHEALMAALRARAADAAQAIWRAHLRNTGRAVAAALGRRS